MQSPTPIIVTRTSSSTTMVSPWDSSDPCPSPTSPTVTATSPMHYRIEQRRSIYVTTDILPSQWDTAQLNHILDLGEIPPGEDVSRQDIRIRLTRSMPDRPVIFYPEIEAKPVADIVEPPRRSSAYHRRRESKVDAAMKHPITSPTSRRGSPRSPTRARVLFYNKSDPHYGFTNFSAHPVVYDNKRYPTSEHLFQSFKVRIKFSAARPLTHVYPVPAASAQAC
jgi:hypothetical protein